jgi:leucyl/phenylalanyl-tRNA--protein transferase
VPIEPPPSPWRLPEPRAWAGEIVGLGADLQPGTLLAAYRAGLFPMPLDAEAGRPATTAWWSPDPRGVLPLDGLVVSRSLRRSLQRYDVRIDTAFEQVVDACAAPHRKGAWITREMQEAYGALHQLGWAHSVEAWSGEELVGGLYGVAIGGLFAGESMFSHATDASKVALVALVRALADDFAADRVLDVQWCTPHLATLGCREVSRRSYLRALRRALALPLPAAFGEASTGPTAAR